MACFSAVLTLNAQQPGEVGRDEEQDEGAVECGEGREPRQRTPTLPSASLAFNFRKRAMVARRESSRP